MMPEFDILRPVGWPRGSRLQELGWGGEGRRQFEMGIEEAHVL